MDELLKYKMLFLIPLFILTLTLIYALYDGKKFRRTLQIMYNNRINNEVFKQTVLDYIYSMDGYTFEDFMGYIFKLNNYNVYVTPRSKDLGKDIILDNKIYVECKCYTSQKITSPTVQKLIGACACDDITHAIFITTGNGYTKDAIKLVRSISEKIKIECWDTLDILNFIIKSDKSAILNWLETNVA